MALRTSNQIISLLIPLMIILTPTTVPIAACCHFEHCSKSSPSQSIRRLLRPWWGCPFWRSHRHFCTRARCTVRLPAIPSLRLFRRCRRVRVRDREPRIPFRNLLANNIFVRFKNGGAVENLPIRVNRLLGSCSLHGENS